MGFSLPKDFNRLFEDERKEWLRIKETFKKISQEFKVFKTSKPSLNGFEVMNSENSFKVLQAYNIEKNENKFSLCIVEYKNSYNHVRQTGGSVRTESHKYLFGFLKTDNNFSKAYLRPENIGDKISEYFNPIELDIKGFKTFNKNYYLLVSQEEIFLKAFNSKIIETIEKYKKLEMEFSGKRCLFRFKKTFELEAIMNLCEFGVELSAKVK